MVPNTEATTSPFSGTTVSELPASNGSMPATDDPNPIATRFDLLALGSMFCPSLRERARRARDLCWPPQALFVLPFLGLETLFCLQGSLSLPREPFWLGPDPSFYSYWFFSPAIGLSLAKWLMLCNTLVVLYLWACVRAEARIFWVKRLFFYSSALVLSYFQWLLFTIEQLQFQAPSYSVLLFP